MVLWRISNYCELTGFGAETIGGRWHTAGAGKRIVYLAEHPALALLEILVNMRGSANQLPRIFQLLRVTVSDSVLAENLDSASLSDGWEAERRGTQLVGNAWLGSAKSALLGVPSAPSPESTNYLLNPLHPDARHCKIEWCRWITYDQRLFGFVER